MIGIEVNKRYILQSREVIQFRKADQMHTVFRVSVVKMHSDQLGERLCKILQSGHNEVEGDGHS